MAATRRCQPTVPTRFLSPGTNQGPHPVPVDCRLAKRSSPAAQGASPGFDVLGRRAKLVSYQQLLPIYSPALSFAAGGAPSIWEMRRWSARFGPHHPGKFNGPLSGNTARNRDDHSILSSALGGGHRHV